jgi:uncharacterized protein (TIGR02265 family)
VEELRTLLDQVRGYCDVVDRIKRVPPGTAVRGIALHALERRLQDADKLDPFHALFPTRYNAIQWIPMDEFLVRLVVGGALLRGPADVHGGMYEIGRANATTFAASLVGQLLLRGLAKDPRLALIQGQAGRRQMAQGGFWTLTFLGAREACVQMVDEFLYIESYMLGAAYGTFEAIQVPAQIEVELEDPFHGRHLIRW